MAFKGFKKTRLNDEGANKALEHVKGFVDQFSFSLIYGRFLTEIDPQTKKQTDLISLSATAKKVPHKLDEKYKGFWVVENDSGETVYNTRVAGSNNDEGDNKFITLTATGSCKAKIWVF